VKISTFVIIPNIRAAIILRPLSNVAEWCCQRRCYVGICHAVLFNSAAIILTPLYYVSQIGSFVVVVSCAKLLRRSIRRAVADRFTPGNSQSSQQTPRTGLYADIRPTYIHYVIVILWKYSLISDSVKT